MFNYYNHETIRKLVIAFGSLFNSITIKQINANGSLRTNIVPLTYGPKEKFIKRITQSSSISDTTRVQFTIPQLAFEMTGMQYDPARHFNKLNKKTIVSSSGATLSFAEVPYNFAFSLYAYTRNIEENLQIMEQILPQFSPEFIVTINFNSLHQRVDVPFFLSATGLTEEYEGDFSTRRLVVSTYQFIARSYVYGEIKQSPIIAGISLGYNSGLFGDFIGTLPPQPAPPPGPGEENLFTNPGNIEPLIPESPNFGQDPNIFGP